MARVRIPVAAGQNPLQGASIYVYTEDTSVAEGAENFDSGDYASIYSDRALSVAQAQPMTTDANGEVTFYCASGTLVAIKITRPGYGTRWLRFQDVTGSDP